MNCNSIRGSHYPQNPIFLDLLDEQGLTFWSEIPIWGVGFSEQALSNETVISRGLKMHEEMIKQYYNHPSIIIWGLHNEILSNTNAGYEISKVKMFGQELEPIGLFGYNYGVIENLGVTNLNIDLTTNAFWVWSDIDRDTLLAGLKNNAAWSSFTNNIVGATATGSPTVDLLLASYNEKNGTELVCDGGDFIFLDSSTEDYDLYVPYEEVFNGCCGYWTCTSQSSRDVYAEKYDALIFADYTPADCQAFSARPVIALPLNTKVALVNGVFKVLD